MPWVFRRQAQQKPWHATMLPCRREYEVYKHQWQSITPVQEARFHKFRDRRHRIGNVAFLCIPILALLMRCFCLFLLRQTICLPLYFHAEKDVFRTDRHVPLFAEEGCPALTNLSDILLTYAFYNFDLGMLRLPVPVHTTKRCLQCGAQKQ